VIYLVIPAAIILGLAIRQLRQAPRDAALDALLVLSMLRGNAALVAHSARVSSGLAASLVLATPPQDSATLTWRVLAVLFSSSAWWTAAVVVRYLLRNVVVMPGE